MKLNVNIGNRSLKNVIQVEWLTEHNISRHIYYYWQSVIRNEYGLACIKQMEETHPVQQATFLPIEPPTIQSNHSTIKVNVGPYSIDVQEDTSIELLQKVIKVLGNVQ